MGVFCLPWYIGYIVSKCKQHSKSLSIIPRLLLLPDKVLLTLNRVVLNGCILKSPYYGEINFGIGGIIKIIGQYIKCNMANNFANFAIG